MTLERPRAPAKAEAQFSPLAMCNRRTGFLPAREPGALLEIAA